ncbi:hypothetical protein J2X20_005902 [Pelomonas saccharophila]|uniref:Putative DNA-binding domain-containing protein n=1 Tax=Roseateles saccharophilus TaxID=304 RepID=A0ABU1YWH1_ROSSA|nr:DNA-binding domain-containing protein [Roseateles saccharophilus]MDR7273212.1 hypothetical protein [Roseateles saccharophilus]
MNALAAVQEAVFDAIWRSSSSSDLKHFDAKFERAIAVHRATCQSALRATLSIAFPATRALLGETDFDAHATVFVLEHPPKSAWLEVYGTSFPEFLKTQRGSVAGDVARLDAALNLALHADMTQDVPPGARPLGELANVSDAMLKMVRLVPHPATQLITTSASAANAWREHALGEPWPTPTSALDQVHLLVYRPEDGVTVEPIEAELLALMLQLKRGSLGDSFRLHGDAVQRHLAWLIQHSVFSAWTSTQADKTQLTSAL